MGLIRLATDDPALAAAQLDKLRWRTQLTQEERSYVWGVIGKRAAQRLSDDAVGLFRQRHRTSSCTRTIWTGRCAPHCAPACGRRCWKPPPRWSEQQRRDPTWIYWRARALLAPGRTEADRAQATQLLESIASVRGFYEQLALEELGRKITRAASAPAPDRQGKGDRRSQPGPGRALHAISIGLRSEGVREWNYAVRLHDPGGMNDRALLAAADLACAARGLGPLHQHQRTHARLHRLRPALSDAAARRGGASAPREIGLDPAYVYGLIRQESRFLMDARSAVGASGLMQVMPATARWTAKKIGLTDFKPNQINDRDTNIAIGTGLPEAGAGRLRRLHAAGRRRLQRRPGAPAQLAQRPGAGGRDLGREHAVQRNPRLRQEGAEQHHQLRRDPDRSAAVAQGAAGQGRPAPGRVRTTENKELP